MIKSTFTFLQVKIESLLRETSKTDQSSFGIPPEIFYPIDMRVFVGKFAVRMPYSKELLIPQIDKSVIPSPPIRVNDTFNANSSPDNSLESRPGAIRDDFRIDFTVAFEQAENNGLSSCATSSDSANTSCAEVTFIDFDFTFTGDSASQ